MPKQMRKPTPGSRGTPAKVGTGMKGRKMTRSTGGPKTVAKRTAMKKRATPRGSTMKRKSY